MWWERECAEPSAGRGVAVGVGRPEAAPTGTALGLQPSPRVRGRARWAVASAPHGAARTTRTSHETRCIYRKFLCLSYQPKKMTMSCRSNSKEQNSKL